MPTADELVLQMQHLQAQARNALDARAHRAGLDRIKSSTQKLAWQCEQEIADCETVERDGETRLDQLREGGVTREEAPEYVAVKRAVDDAKKRLVKARAQLNFALDRMEEVERREYLAFHAEVRAETHGALVDEALGGPAVPE